jgi:hypothetical protein
MKTRSITVITKWWLAVAVVLALLPWVGMARAAADLDQQLIEAAARGDMALVKTLLEKGAHVNGKDRQGETALVSAATEGHLELVRLLLEKGAELNAKDKEGSTALIRAMDRRHGEVAKLLLAKGADFNLSSGARFDRECEVADAKRPMIDLVDLMSLFMIPASVLYSVLPWETGAQPGSPIEWKTDGIEWRQPAKADLREGEAIVTIDGKPLCRLRKYIEPAPWTIALMGSRAGVHQIQITPQAECTVPLEAQLHKRNISLELYRCDPKPFASEEKKIYSIKAPNKKRAWLYIDVGCGSGGCSCTLTLFLNQTEADQVPGLDTDCRETAAHKTQPDS